MKTKLKKSLSALLAFMMVFSFIAYIGPIEADARATLDTYRHADKYGTPVWDGNDTYYSKWNSGSSYTTFTWPKHIYLDISETLESAGYYYTVEWDYGNGTDYRIVNNGFIFGGWRMQNPSNWPENYNTMNRMFSNYDLDASTHGTQDGIDGGSSTDFDLKVGNDNWDAAQVIIWRNPNGDNSAQHQYVFMKGTPNTTGYGLYSTSGAKPTSFGGWQYWSNGWKNASDKYTTSNTSSNWTTDCYEGTWKEVRFEITVYDKADLNFAKQKSDMLLEDITPYLSYITAGYDNYVSQHNATANTLKTRVVTQAGLTTQITTLSTAANALRFAASNSALLTAINNARAKMAEADYETKYTKASRTAFETALNNATASSYDDSISTYAINFSDNSTWDAGKKADADQTAINNLATAINTALAGLETAYSITFEFANGTTDTKAYDAGETVSVPDNSTKASDAENHYSYSWTPAVNTTATANATYKEELKTEAHSWSAWTQTQDPTCTAEGSKQRICTVCEYIETDSVDMIDHKPATTEANRVEASCGADGSYDIVTYCDVCGHIIDTEHKTIPATDHDWGEWAVETPATCAEDGVEKRVCKNDATHFETKPIPATGEHVYSTEKEKVEATCTEIGYVIMACACGKEERTEFEATDHDWGKWAVETPATCAEDGVKKRVCKNDAAHFETKPIPATGEHVYSTEKEKVEATCTEIGYVIMACACGKEERTEFEATDHDWGKWAVETPATCAEDGVEKRVCKNDAAHFETKPIPATGEHVYSTEKEKVEATCTEIGYVIMACACGKEDKTIFPATDHDWGEWTQTNPPTATEKGEEARICGKCGETETRPVPALGTDEDEPTPDQPDVPENPDDSTEGNCETCGKNHTNIFQKIVCWLMKVWIFLVNMFNDILIFRIT